MSKAKPFTWIVRMTVAPLWIQDGFTISNERAQSMLANALQCAHSSEFEAQVLEAPSPPQLTRMRGYGPNTPGAGKDVREIIEGCNYKTDTGKLHGALLKARNLLDSVAFVAKEGDTAPVIAMIDEALALINTRQGEAVDVED